MLNSRIPRIAAELQAALDEVAGAGAHVIADAAKQRAPDRTPIGEGLVAAIHVDEQPEGFYVVAGDSDVFYGHLVEHGTSHSAPHPFLVPSLEANRKQIIAAATAVLRKIT